MFIQVVFELPLGHQDVEVTGLLKELQVPHGDVGGEYPLELPTPGILILCLHQDANIIWGQDVQDRRIKILKTRAIHGQREANYILVASLLPSSLLRVPQAEVSICLRSLGHTENGKNLGSVVTAMLMELRRSPVLQPNLSYRYCWVAHKASVLDNLHGVSRQRLQELCRDTGRAGQCTDLVWGLVGNVLLSTCLF